MPYNPGGIFSLVASYIANPGTTIRTEQHNPVFEDVGSALSQVLIRDGRAPMTGPLNMNGFPINNVVAGNTPSSVATLAQATPIGVVSDFAGSTAPAGWMLCYGQAVSRSTYAALFAVIGTTYGAGDGSTTFNLPDARGLTVAGFDSMGGAAANRLPGAFGGRLGVASTTIAKAQLPNVGLSVSVSGAIQVDTNGAQFMYTPNGVLNITGAFQPGGSSTVGSAAASGIVTSYGTANLSGSTAALGSGSSFSLVQPTLIMNKIIRVSYDG